MANYDFDDFLSSVRHLDYEDILMVAKQRLRELEKALGTANKKEALILNTQIEGFLYWLKTGNRPKPMSFIDFAKLRPICENLIAKRQLKANTIHVFSTVVLK